MKFQKIEIVSYNINLCNSLKNSQYDYNSREGFIIKLYIDNYCGYGEASPLPLFSKENLKSTKSKVSVK